MNRTQVLSSLSNYKLVITLILQLLFLHNNININVQCQPSGFIDEGVVTRSAIITGTFAPNPRLNGKPMLLLSTKNGQIYVVEDPDNSEDNFIIGDIQDLLCNNGERGLQSLVVHPNFIENQYIFMFYSRFTTDCPESDTTGPHNRVSRFTMDVDTLQIDLSSEVLILETSPIPKKMHNGGSMSFGKDGYLYITTGDGGLRDPPNSQLLHNLLGKVLRINPDNIDTNNGRLAPIDNPFTVESGTANGVPCGTNGGIPILSKDIATIEDAICEEIFAYGLRNPFRLVMNPNTANDTVMFHVGDVGASVWEEISVGGTEYMGVNYGWPIHEGPCIIGSSVDCPIATADDGNFIEPHHYYIHTALEEGGCVTGAAFVPDGIGWPAEYKYLFIDFIFDTVYNLIETPDTECRECIPPVPGYTNETFYERDVMVDMFFGPYNDTQALYIISRATEGQAIRRIRYTGSTNAAPIANFTVSTSMADIDTVIEFDASDSIDTDGDDITYLWDFGDGTGTSTEIIVQYSYSAFGIYIVKLTVTDSKDQTNQVQMTITVGIPPTAEIISPADMERFSVGQILTVEGTATDANGVVLADTQISWEVQQHHSLHFHPFLDRQSGQGNGFALDPAPAPEDFLAADNSFLRIIMYATDSFGLVTQVVRDVLPKKVFLTIDSDPPGLEVLVDEYAVTTPRNVTSWENHKLHLSALNQSEYIFSNWSFGGPYKTNYTVPARQDTIPTIVATFVTNSSDPATTTAPAGPVAVAPIAAPVAVVPTTAPIKAPVPVDVTGSPILATTTKPTSAPITAPVPTTNNNIDLTGSSNAIMTTSNGLLHHLICIAVVPCFTYFYFV